MTYFGDDFIQVEEYKKTKINIFEVFKDVQKGIPPQEDLLIPINRWYSNNINNISLTQSINMYFYYTDKKVLSRMLTLNISKHIKFIKTLPKKQQDELEFLKKYICKYYNWSESEYEKNKDLIDLYDSKLHEFLNKMYGFEKNELNLLGLKQPKINTKFEDVKKTKGYF